MLELQCVTAAPTATLLAFLVRAPWRCLTRLTMATIRESRERQRLLTAATSLSHTPEESRESRGGRGGEMGWPTSPCMGRRRAGRVPGQAVTRGTRTGTRAGRSQGRSSCWDHFPGQGVDRVAPLSAAQLGVREDTAWCCPGGHLLLHLLPLPLFLNFLSLLLGPCLVQQSQEGLNIVISEHLHLARHPHLDNSVYETRMLCKNIDLGRLFSTVSRLFCTL